MSKQSFVVWFLKYRMFRRIMWEKQKMLASSVFKFTNNIFWNKSYQFVLCSLFTKRQISDLSKLKAFADKKNKCNLNMEILYRIGRKHCRNRRKCWLPTSPFPTTFSTISRTKYITLARFKVPRAADQKYVSLQNTSKSHSYHLTIWLLL